MLKQQIIAMGGGGFSMESTPLLDDYTLSSAGDNPRICFMAIASGDSTEYINRFYRRFSQTNYQPTHLELFRRDQRDLEAFLLSQDIIYVSGGNTANMLAIWAVHGVDRILKKSTGERGCALWAQRRFHLLV